MDNAFRPAFLILDGGSIHRSQPVREYVATLKGRLRLFFLPSYSSELNPDEQMGTTSSTTAWVKRGCGPEMNSRTLLLPASASSRHYLGPFECSSSHLTPNTLLFDPTVPSQRLSACGRINN